ncbi:2-isopropylmalate synthase [archaeon HR01]|nr:2-isopropylmalate synthase [archaeon HR01]
MSEPWKSEKHWVSPFNYTLVSGFNFPEKIEIHDVTLRDGEQTPGVVLRSHEKLEIARALDELGVHRIEAGMPVVSAEDAEAVRLIAREGLKARIFAFARLVKEDIDAALKADVSGIVTEGPVGVPKLAQFGWQPDMVLEKAVEYVEYAKAHGLYTVFFGVDGTRADLGFLKKIYSAVVREAHADAVTVVDTFGCSTPEAFRRLVEEVGKTVNAPLEVHCHNDFGLGTACSVMGLAGGASVVHVSVNGIGERAGNAALEEVALSLELLYGRRLGLDYSSLVKVSRIVEKYTGFRVAPNKPIVGGRVFTRESGIAVAGWMKYHLGSEAFLPELVGNRHDVLVGKKSGRHSLEWKLKQLGQEATSEELQLLLEAVKQRSLEKKGPVEDEELLELLRTLRLRASH